MLKTLLPTGAAILVATGAQASVFAFDFSGSVEFISSGPTIIEITDVAEITPGSTIGFADYLLADSFTVPVSLEVSTGAANAGESFSIDYSNDMDMIADGSLTFTLGETNTALETSQFVFLDADVEIVDSNGQVTFAAGEFLFSTQQSGLGATDSFSATITAMSAIPLPTTGLLLGGALLGFGFLRHRTSASERETLTAGV